MKVVIYKIVSTVDGKVYVGSTVNLANRWKCHRTHLRGGTHHSRYLQFAWNIHGEANFSHVVIAECAELDRDKVEQHWIDALRSCDSSVGYNMGPVATTKGRRKHTQETKNKMRASATGKVKTEIHRARISLGQRGRITTPETRALLSAALKGRVVSEDTRKKLSARRGTWNHTNETREKLRQSSLGRVINTETRAKIAAACIGRKWTEQQRIKILSRPRASFSDESRAKLSASRGGAPFKVIGADGTEKIFQTLSEANVLGLDSSNIQKCLIGKAKQTKGYRCEYYTPQLIGQV